MGGGQGWEAGATTIDLSNLCIYTTSPAVELPHFSPDYTQFREIIERGQRSGVNLSRYCKIAVSKLYPSFP